MTNLNSLFAARVTTWPRYRFPGEDVPPCEEQAQKRRAPSKELWARERGTSTTTVADMPYPRPRPNFVPLRSIPDEARPGA